MTTTTDIGRLTEQAAIHFLEQQGLQLLANNIRYKFGELDLIMKQQEVLVFVEVRYRSNMNYGGALESITATKRARLERAALAYLQSNGLSNKVECRFDLMALTGPLDNIIFQWVKNIFQ